MGDSSRRAGAVSNSDIITMALLAVGFILAAGTVLNGPSLDDFWTVYLADPGASLSSIAANRWPLDIRPPLFDAWASVLGRLGISAIPLARLASNLPALVLLIMAVRRFAAKSSEPTNFHYIFLLLALTAPATVRAFSLYRGDFWQLAAFAIQILLGHHILNTPADYRRRRDGMLALIGLVATLAAILLDYGGALFGATIALATIIAAIARGLRRWVRLILFALLIALAAVISSLSWQAPFWSSSFDLYQNWIEMGQDSSSAVLIAMLFGTFLHNPVAAAGAYIGRKAWTRFDIGFVVLLGATLIASLIALSEIDAQKRLITESNSSDIALMIAALMATAGSKLVDRRPWMLALAGVAVFSSLASLAALGVDGRWQSGAKKISRTVTACPSTEVFAASGWRLDSGSGSHAAAREEPVFALGYTYMANAHGFAVRLIRPGSPLVAKPGQCPTLLWIERVPAHRSLVATKVLAAAGLRGLDQAKLSIERTSTGLVLRAEH